MDAPSLRELQGLFWEAIADVPGESHPAPALLRVIGGGALAPDARVAIYADMYWARILDVLRGDFATTCRLLGDATFERLARAYLAARPSRHPSIARVGERLPAFLARQPSLPPQAADLARLEWAREVAFTAAAAEPLRLGELATLPAEEWPELRLTAVPSLEVVELRWPVQRLLDAPLADDLPEVTAEPTTVRVWRRGETVFHATVEATERAPLAFLRAGATFGAIGEACADAPQAAAVLARWLEDELVVAATGR